MVVIMKTNQSVGKVRLGVLKTYPTTGAIAGCGYITIRYF
jgi:hypothetical protein